MNTLNLIFLVLLITTALSCSDDKIADFDTLRSQYSGVSEFDSQGKRIKQVDTDWEPECYEISGFGKSHFCFYATYPLPATDTLTIWIASAIVGNYKMWLSLNDTTIAMPLIDEKKGIGDFKLKIPFVEERLHRNLVYRLFVESTDSTTKKTQIHFGDVIWN
ncbi:MAG: hypothetical protein CVV25_11845 [Ignavibacteriae bacterium HGW-Ignavibacteriae-4]|jgi:hypothetical protein|nr:MAG: hypothetical protein CVV25_11845 [Ignavibacteriae bacterium HGW-Ignavibacteriae-4]